MLPPGGKLLLLSTEDTLAGQVCGRLWHCRTYRRADLEQRVRGVRPALGARLWFTGLHRMMRMGGIVAELRRG